MNKRYETEVRNATEIYCFLSGSQLHWTPGSRVADSRGQRECCVPSTRVLSPCWSPARLFLNQLLMPGDGRKSEGFLLGRPPSVICRSSGAPEYLQSMSVKQLDPCLVAQRNHPLQTGTRLDRKYPNGSCPVTGKNKKQNYVLCLQGFIQATLRIKHPYIEHRNSES